MRKGWKRLFMVAAVCWTVAAPLWMMNDYNRPVDETVRVCGVAASETLFDRGQYKAEVDKCISAYLRDFMPIQEAYGALVGLGHDPMHTKLLWGVILVPLGFLWAAGWTIGRTFKWVAEGFTGKA
jgi:hypothetical protein